LDLGLVAADLLNDHGRGSFGMNQL
jgi:hypothetical protein